VDQELKDIIKGCKKHNTQAQKDCYSRFYGKMFPLCLRYVGQREEAQEVLNDAFLKVFTSINQYQGIGSFEGWIRKIVVHKCLDYLRSVSRHRNTIKNPDTFFCPTTISSEAEEQHHYYYLSWLLNGLPEQHKNVFNLFVLDGYNHQEIGRKLNITVANSKYCLHQARKALQENLKTIQENERS
tara:strand:+ start:842 stop:1393 length:552 start_codon:yes stop_codon:yes gene_type:complete